MPDRPSRLRLMYRMYITIFLILTGISLFTGFLGGRVMLTFDVIFFVALNLTLLITGVGWLVVNLGAAILLADDPEFREWRMRGGRSYWDSLPWPINPSSAIERETGLAEPDYTDFVPPADWRYQCPVCGSRVEKEIDVCWRCGYGADGDSTAYYQRRGDRSDKYDCT